MSRRAATAPRASLIPKLLAIVLVPLLLVAGVWFTGAKVTNDFTAAMLLTTAWIGGFGLLCLALAFKRRQYAVPILAAYLLSAGAVGIYLGRSLFLDDTVNERVVSAPESPRVPPAGKERPAPQNIRLGQGSFRPVAHSVEGTATTIRRARGGRVLTLTDFEVDNGPDLRVLLVAGPARNESEVDDFRDLGALKGNKGNQQYEIPGRLDLRRYTTVVIWCRAFSVNFARAPL